MTRHAVLPASTLSSQRKTFGLGVVLALLWICVALPDLAATFAGNRPTNDISFSPAWLKGLRDVFTVGLAIWLCRKASAQSLTIRIATCLLAGLYAVLAISQGTGLLVAVRGVIWMFPLVWTWTARPQATVRMQTVIYGALSILVPAGVVTSLALGFGGVGMYYESIGPYERNPGLLLSPSATAFIACLAFLYASRRYRRLGRGSLALGLLSVSGIFYINAGLLFGKLPKIAYVGVGIVVFATLFALGLEGVINAIANLNSGLRDGSSVSATLLARTVIFASAIDTFSLLGNYPLGLNVAANNDIEQFFPDNAYLAAAYAFGVVGIAASIFITAYAASRRSWSLLILLITTSMFYVWFENALFCLLVGCLLNRHVVVGTRLTTSTHG
ncbi:MAG: hypothetical protein Q7J29_00630 [Stagnimonas sp.]|nr:hypothetical protein [Stagnimonas sp.]